MQEHEQHHNGQALGVEVQDAPASHANADAIREDHMEHLCDEYRRHRREEGATKAARQWIDRPFEAWLAGFGGDGTALDDESIAALSAAMVVSLPVRDAMILSLIAPESCGDKAMMIRFASSPHEPQVQVRMCRELQRAFHDDSHRPDLQRCQRGADMLADMIVRLPDRFAVQPMVILAYVMWWIGDSRAAAFALHCLSVDDDCTLAAIICSAVHRGIMPAWIGRQ
ncbi:DUF4192 family protein [Bifidobacterium leontopitheci]|uniref:DUF4192 domain-containing protein n=1 Tax=Bifidobacterium leontopitheci TaxID=2650774 RepID=A0A6I1GPJ1_9BIFI|nr:DUF4192 family protein [Bifidobacterium leontopitheci]KAB7791197.1 hypothetical protein F7D09_0363 [Bifidobacterium leontopitheci]